MLDSTEPNMTSKILQLSREDGSLAELTVWQRRVTLDAAMERIRPTDVDVSVTAFNSSM